MKIFCLAEPKKKKKKKNEDSGVFDELFASKTEKIKKFELPSLFKTANSNISTFKSEFLEPIEDESNSQNYKFGLQVVPLTFIQTSSSSFKIESNNDDLEIKEEDNRTKKSTYFSNSINSTNNETKSINSSSKSNSRLNIFFNFQKEKEASEIETENKDNPTKNDVEQALKEGISIVQEIDNSSIVSIIHPNLPVSSTFNKCFLHEDLIESESETADTQTDNSSSLSLENKEEVIDLNQTTPLPPTPIFQTFTPSSQKNNENGIWIETFQDLCNEGWNLLSNKENLISISSQQTNLELKQILEIMKCYQNQLNQLQHELKLNGEKLKTLIRMTNK